MRGELARSRSGLPLFRRLPSNQQPTSSKTQVFCFSFDTKEKRSLPVFYTFQIFSAYSFTERSALNLPDPATFSQHFVVNPPGSCF